jgi:hypothetical protein
VTPLLLLVVDIVVLGERSSCGSRVLTDHFQRLLARSTPFWFHSLDPRTLG